MLDLSVRYPGQIDTSDPTGYPQGKARNITVPSDGTGTPWEQDLANDQILGPNQALLDAVDIAANGNVEKAGASQFVDALRRLVEQHTIMSWRRSADPSGFTNPITGGDYWRQDGVFLVASGSSDEVLMSYDDGASWIDTSGGMASGLTQRDVAIDNTNDVAISAGVVGGSKFIYRRTTVDGGSWTTVALPGSVDQIYTATYVEGLDRFLVLGGNGSSPYAATSDDQGATWTERTIPGGFGVMGPVAVSTGSTVVAATQSAHTKLAVSTDGGVTWANSTTTLPSKSWHVAYNPNLAKFLALSDDGLSARDSTDGTTWTSGIVGTGSLTTSDGDRILAALGHGWVMLASRSGRGNTSLLYNFGEGTWKAIDFATGTTSGRGLVADSKAQIAIAGLVGAGADPAEVYASPRMAPNV